MSRTRRKIKRPFDVPVFLLAAACVLVGLEFVLQLTVLFFPSTESFFVQKSKTQEVRITVGEMMVSGGQRTDAQPDPHGFRNPYIPEHSYVVAFGDAMTYGAEVAWQDAWPGRLGEILGETVYNMARSAGSPADYFLLFPEALRQDPQWLLVPLNLTDDFVETSIKVYSDSSLVNFRNEERDVAEAVLRQESQAPLLMPVEVNRTADAARRTKPGHVWEFKTLQLLQKAAGWPRSKQSGTLKVSSLDARGWDDEDLERIRKQAEIRYHSLDRTDVRVSEGLRLDLELLRAMRETAARQNKKMLVLLIPTRESVMAHVYIRAGGSLHGAYQKLVEEEDHIRGKIHAFLDAQNIPMVDLFPPLRKMAADGVNPYTSETNVSFNAVGHELVAERLTVWLKQARRRHETPEVQPTRPRRTVDAARSAAMRGLAVSCVAGLILILLKTTPWQNRRPILLLVLYLAVQTVLFWNPIEFFPITAFQQYSRPVPRAIDYGRIIIVTDQESRKRWEAKEILPAFSGARLHRMVNTAFRKPEAARDLAGTLSRLCRERGLGSVREVRFEEWKWDYLSDPHDSDRGFMVRRLTVNAAGEAILA